MNLTRCSAICAARAERRAAQLRHHRLGGVGARLRGAVHVALEVVAAVLAGEEQVADRQPFGAGDRRPLSRLVAGVAIAFVHGNVGQWNRDTLPLRSRVGPGYARSMPRISRTAASSAVPSPASIASLPPEYSVRPPARRGCRKLLSHASWNGLVAVGRAAVAQLLPRPRC